MVCNVCIVQSERGGGLYTRYKLITYAGTWAKNTGGLCTGGGRNHGILQYYTTHIILLVHFSPML